MKAPTIVFSDPAAETFQQNSSMRNQELFNLMSREHGITLLESEMHEIELVVARTLANDCAHEPARPNADSVSCTGLLAELETALLRLIELQDGTSEVWGYDEEWTCVRDALRHALDRETTDVRRYSRSNPECFEGEWWHWSGRMYAPIQMVHGTIQMHCMAHRAVRAWREFERVTGKTKAQLMADGYRVKAILLVPGWKIKAPNAEAHGLPETARAPRGEGSDE